MILSDRDIRAELAAGRIVIDPFDPDAVQPSSVDLHLDRTFRVFRNTRYPFIDVREEQPDLTELVSISGDEPFILHPGEFVLGSTFERVALPDDLVARLEGKSSLGRLGLLIHSTAGYVDPGWDGNLTLELSNVANLPITLVRRDEDRPDQLPAAVEPGRAGLRRPEPGVTLPRPDRADRQPLLRRLRAGARPPVRRLTLPPAIARRRP